VSILSVASGRAVEDAQRGLELVKSRKLRWKDGRAYFCGYFQTSAKIPPHRANSIYYKLQQLGVLIPTRYMIIEVDQRLGQPGLEGALRAVAVKHGVRHLRQETFVYWVDERRLRELSSKRVLREELATIVGRSA